MPTTDWTDREAMRAWIAAVPRDTALRVAARAAERALPTMATATHPDTLERWNTLDAARAVVARHLAGGSVSKFTLRQARDLSYDVADHADTPAADAVLYVASAALDGDPTRSLVESLRAAVRAVPEQAELVELDRDFAAGLAEPLWPLGEPDWFRDGRTKLALARMTLPALFRWPADAGEAVPGPVPPDAPDDRHDDTTAPANESDWSLSSSLSAVLSRHTLHPPAATAPPTEDTRVLARNRYRGCLLGLAAGDALGTTVEFCGPGTFPPLTDIVGGGPFHLKPGEWTDDTSMALCLAESLIEKGGHDPVHQLETYCRWWLDGHLSVKGRCFDIGTTTRRALAAFKERPRPYPGGTDEWSSGNGGIMRLAPVPMRFAANPEQAIVLAAQSSRTTHGSWDAVDAARYMAGLIVGALEGRPKAELLSAGFSPVPGLWEQAPLTPKIRAVADGSFKLKDPPQIEGAGYVVQSLEAALWAFDRSDNFRDGALLAVNLGDDADTTGAVYGQIAGAFYGEDGVPADWRAKLAMRELIERRADELFRAATAA